MQLQRLHRLHTLKHNFSAQIFICIKKLTNQFTLFPNAGILLVSRTFSLLPTKYKPIYRKLENSKSTE